ncbi:MAG TPA: universal stress protein [Polyangiaceae bacterium]|nr:universal stress protein [Polyangiaceae bacterium]
MFEKIMVPVDFSEHSTLAFGHARLLASAFGAELELVHVVEQVVHSHPSFWSAEPALADELHQQSIRSAEALVADLVHKHADELGQDIVPRIVSGSLPGALADYATESDTDLIVLSTHGRTGFARWLMGSVSERVLRVAPCSVLVVRGAAPASSVQRVLVAVDLSEHSRRALEVAALVAARLGASLEVLHVWTVAFYADEGTGRAGLLDRMRETARAELDVFVDATTLPTGVVVARTIVSGAPTAAISEHVASRHPDLLVLGTHGYGGVKRMVLGSVAEALARYAGCATLVVR